MDQQEALTTDCRLLQEEFKKSSESRRVIEDVGDFLEAALTYVGQIVPVDVLDEKFANAGLWDIRPVRELADHLRDAKAEDWTLEFADGTRLQGADLLRDIYTELNAFDSVQSNQGNDEASIRLVLRASRDLERLLYAAAQGNVNLPAAMALLQKQLLLSNDRDVDELWNRIHQEIDQSRTRPLNIAGFPEGFFDLAPAHVLRQRIAEFVGQLVASNVRQERPVP